MPGHGIYTRGIQNTARCVSMDAKEMVTIKEMESGDPNRGLDKAWIHMETEGDDKRDRKKRRKVDQRDAFK